jgi:hypothetical protein
MIQSNFKAHRPRGFTIASLSPDGTEDTWCRPSELKGLPLTSRGHHGRLSAMARMADHWRTSKNLPKTNPPKPKTPRVVIQGRRQRSGGESLSDTDAPIPNPFLPKYDFSFILRDGDSDRTFPQGSYQGSLFFLPEKNDLHDFPEMICVLILYCLRLYISYVHILFRFTYYALRSRSKVL